MEPTTSIILTRPWVAITSGLTRALTVVRLFLVQIQLPATGTSQENCNIVVLVRSEPDDVVLTGNWCIQGPVVDFRHSTDKGETWTEERVNATGPSDNLFGETAAHNSKVKFGARKNMPQFAARPARALCLITVHLVSYCMICLFAQRIGLTSDKNLSTAQMEKHTW